VTTECGGEGILLASVPMLNLVAKSDKEFDVRPDRLIRPRPSMGHTASQALARRLFTLCVQAGISGWILEAASTVGFGGGQALR
jgi:hypothetical protein